MTRFKAMIILAACLMVVPFLAILFAGVGNVSGYRPHVATASARVSPVTELQRFNSLVHVPSTRPAQPSSQPATPVTVSVQRYTVRPGDSLSAIAARYHVQGGWPRLYAANRSVLGTDPDLIYAGQQLTL